MIRRIKAIFRSAEQQLEFDRVKAAGLEYALTSSGRALFLSLQPSASLEHVTGRLELLRQMIILLDRGEDPPTEGLCDLHTVLDRLALPGCCLDGPEFLLIASFLRFVRSAHAFFSRLAERAPLLHRAFASFAPLPDLMKMISDILDEEGNVRDDASPELKKLSADAARIEKRVQSQISTLIRRLEGQNVLQEGFSTLRGERFVVPVRSGARSRVPGIVHDVSSSGETFFIEPMSVVEETNELAACRLRRRDEIRRILFSLTDEARSYHDHLRVNSETAAQFDLLRAMARFSFRNNFSIPSVGEGLGLDLLRAHHPLLFLQDASSSVPISIRLRPEDRVLVVSGPNAGGKTTALKTLGLLSLMAQSGMAIPAWTDSRLPLFKTWFADIGDAQDITEGVSTFSAHIRNMARILEQADSGSLVLLDELGTATDPAEGGCLAVSCLERLAARGALTIATSHLSPLKAWAHEFPGARNASFRLDDVTRQPTFHMELDVPGDSEAFHIARREGLPEDVLQRAMELLPKGEADLSRVIQSLRQKEKEVETKSCEAARLHQELHKLQKRIVELQDVIREKERRMKQDMLHAREHLLSQTRELIEREISDLSSKKNAVQARKNVEREIQQVRAEQKILSEESRPRVDPSLFAAGCSVIISGMTDPGVIKFVDPLKARAVVIVNGIEITTPLSSLILPEPDEPPPPVVTHFVFRKNSNFSIELDLHGMRVDEMLAAVDQYLSDALMADVPYVKLLHGIGTGALRRALHDCLRSHPMVREYRFGCPEEGGGGVTIVKFHGEDTQR